MKLLALETSQSSGSAAAFDDDKLLYEIDLPRDQGSAQSLAPTIDHLLKEVEWTPPQVELVAVTAGPGSFTGLRVGVTTAKVFAYAVQAQVLGIDTLQAVAARCPAEIESVWTAINAQRGDVVAAQFHRQPGSDWAVANPSRLVPLEVWLTEIPTGGWVAGPILTTIVDRLPAGVQAVPPEYWTPRASGVGQVALREFAAGRRDDLWALAPRYFRRSAAEEKLCP